MYDLDRMERLKAIMDRHAKIKPAEKIDIRPASGMVGQNCEGYVPDAETGRLIRVVAEPITECDLGPGRYDPMTPASTKTVKISRNKRNTDPTNRNVKPGPCDYCHEPKSTRLLHNLIQAPEPPLPDPPLGASLEHKSWLPQPLSRLPQAAHPETRFRTDLKTSQFVSGTHRELFPQKYRSPGPVVHTRQAGPVEFQDNEESPPFKDRIDRFAITGPFPPPSTAYTMPEAFGTSQSKRIVKGAEIKRSEPFITPDGAQYAPEVVQRPDTSSESPVFKYRRERFLDDSDKTPAPGDYEIRRDITRGTQKTGIREKKRKVGDEWDDIPQRCTPGVGEYEQDVEKRPKSGYISRIGHNPYDPKEDRPLAFRTQHSSFVKRSFNAHYLHLADPDTSRRS